MAMIHVNRGATSLGAFPEEQVREGIRAGRFLASDLGWREGMASWQPLSQFTEFAEDLAAAAPAPTAPSPQTPTPSTMVAPSAGSTTAAPQSGLPWDERHSKGLFSAFIETLQMVLSKPGAAFTAMKREGGFGEPLLYGLIGGSFGFIVYFIYNLAFQSFGMFANRSNPFAHFIGAIGGIFLLVCAPLFVLIGIFVGSAILHVCLLLVGGAKQSFETTVRVVCFAGGSVNPLLVIPFCGGLIVGVWKIVLYCIGLARAHETDTGRAVVAVLLPVIVCCGGAILLGIMFGVLGAWSASQH
jgi:hypothetical protein